MLAFDFVTTTTRIGILCIFFHLTGAARKWDYEPLLLPTTSSDESKLKFEAKIERLGRSDYGLSGIIEWKYDTNEETMVEAQAYRSNSGDESDYKLLPWAIPKQPFYDYLNTYYKDRKWDYEPVSIIASSSDDSLIKIEPSIVRLGRGKFGVSVLVEWNYDTTDETMVGKCIEGSGDESDYKLLPWAIPMQSFYDYLNTYYKDVIMKNFAPCCNVPQFEDKFQPPWPKQTYIGDKCVIEGEGLPDIVPPGFYKIIFNCTGPDQPFKFLK
ncbi:GM21861 [Drosophila sechellia]|uniref:GM21861 n=1 Tax=Drosophila sechellia TaxID=7238 RepID=B4HNL4_DROSE|nr:GM21861 [Drosophila sechellia]